MSLFANTSWRLQLPSMKLYSDCISLHLYQSHPLPPWRAERNFFEMLSDSPSFHPASLSTLCWLCLLHSVSVSFHQGLPFHFLWHIVLMSSSAALIGVSLDMTWWDNAGLIKTRCKSVSRFFSRFFFFLPDLKKKKKKKKNPDFFFFFFFFFFLPNFFFFPFLT